MTPSDFDFAEAAELSAAMTAWVQQDDPLIGALPSPATGEDIRDAWRAASGKAIALARSVDTPLSSELSLWSASTNDILQLRLSHDATANDVAEMLDRWLAVRDAPTTEPDGDYARTVRLPIAVRQAVLPLVERGFVPATTTLVRRLRVEEEKQHPAAQIRAARPEDREAMSRLMQELIDTEVDFGAVRRRAPGLGDPYVDEALEIGDGWTLVAEADGVVVGWLGMSPADKSEWAQPSISASPITYLGIATVTRSRRSAGIGTALAAAAHARAAAAGASHSVLDASVLNSWSMPFWQRCGYRPLWTTWQRRRP